MGVVARQHRRQCRRKRTSDTSSPCLYDKRPVTQPARRLRSAVCLTPSVGTRLQKPSSSRHFGGEKHVTNTFLAHKRTRGSGAIFVFSVTIRQEGLWQLCAQVLLTTRLSLRHHRKCVCLRSAFLYQSQTAGARALHTMRGFRGQSTQTSPTAKGNGCINTILVLSLKIP